MSEETQVPSQDTTTTVVVGNVSGNNAGSQEESISNDTNGSASDANGADNTNPPATTTDDHSNDDNGLKPLLLKRLNKATWEKEDYKRQLEETQAKLVAYENNTGLGSPDKIVMSKEELDKFVGTKAAEIAAINIFNERCNEIADKGRKEFKGKFDDALGNLKAVGLMETDFLETAVELPNAHRVLAHLGDNPEEAARLANLSSRKRDIELARISLELNTSQQPSQPTSRMHVSNAPAPLQQVTSRGGPSEKKLEDASDMKEYAAIRERQIAERVKFGKSRW